MGLGFVGCGRMGGIPVNLPERSLEIIKANQADTGAYLASPSFPDYRYAWLRDGAFVAYAMDLAGEHGSARRFHEWAAGTVTRYAWKVEQLRTRGTEGHMTGGDVTLHARYTVTGDEVGLPWGNFQLDGCGAWLWSLAGHAARAGHLPAGFRPAVNLAADYLLALWGQPCFDCWEEHGEWVHPSTLAAVYGGLRAVAPFLGRADLGLAGDGGTLAAIRAAVLATRVPAGHFPKFIGTEEVDSSLIWLATPFAVVEPGDPAMELTVRRVARDLQAGVGLHRYRHDTYYGGGLWIPATAFYGWHLARLGRYREAGEILAWIERQAGEDGALPEQVPGHLNSPPDYDRWREEKGPVASPLLWSHAMYLILRDALARRG